MMKWGCLIQQNSRNLSTVQGVNSLHFMLKLDVKSPVQAISVGTLHIRTPFTFQLEKPTHRLISASDKADFLGLDYNLGLAIVRT